MLDRGTVGQAIFQLNHAGRATRGHDIRAALFDGPSLPFENCLCRVIILDDIGSRPACTAVRILHFDGVVFGTEEEAQWTHVDGVTRRRFLNPMIQNEGRRRALANVVPEVPVDGLVVFTGRVDFPNPLPKGAIHISALGGFLARHVFGPSRIDDWDAVWMSVQAAALTDEATRRDFEAQLSFS